MPYEVRQAKDKGGNPVEGWYYVELGANGEVMNTSELFVSEVNAERGIEDAKRVAGLDDAA
jgi:uncharacterized protein YegP (UPF0339 family)